MSHREEYGSPMQQETLTLLIRPYREEDWCSLCSVHDAARLQELGASIGIAAFQTLEEVGVSEGLFDGTVAVGVVNERIVGFVAYTAEELTWLYVDPASQGNGYGRLLLRHALAQSNGEMTTEALVGNDIAVGLYLSEGFEIQEIRQGRLSGNPSFPAAAHILKRTKCAM